MKIRAFIAALFASTLSAVAFGGGAGSGSGLDTVSVVGALVGGGGPGLDAFQAAADTSVTPLFFGVYNGANQNTGSPQELGIATSTDDYHYVKDPSNPVLTLGAGGTYDSALMAQPTVVQAFGKRFLYYSAYNNIKWVVALATASTSGGPWSKVGIVLNPVSGWDSAQNYYPTSRFNGTTIEVWYLGTNGGGTYSIGHATSVDGFNLVKDPANPVLTPTVAWESTIVAPDFVIDDKLFFEGYGSSLVRVGRATFSGGVYTKYASNPIISPHTSASTTLTVNATAGDTTITVTSAGTFNVGMTCFIQNASVDEPVRILSKTATTMTFYSPLVNSYLSGSTIVECVKSKVSLRGIVVDGALYRGLLTAFGATTRQREVVTPMTSTDLLTWAFDYTRPLVIPLGTGSDWDATSAENLMVIGGN